MEQLVRGEVDTDVALQLGSWHEELDLSHQNWASEMPDWWDRLCAALGASTVLRSLTISHVRLTQPQMQSLHGALKLNDSLTTLTLNDSCITDAALSALSPAFVVNTCLTTLRLAGNEVTNQGLAALFADILQTDTVTELDLSRNPLAEAGTQCLAAYVAHSTALAALSMAGTCPSQAALTAVCAALPQSRSLKKLDVCDMPLDMMLFAEQLVENRGITHLALSSCSVHVASLPMHRLRCLDIAGAPLSTEEARALLTDDLFFENHIEDLRLAFASPGEGDPVFYRGFNDYIMATRFLKSLTVWGGFGGQGNNHIAGAIAQSESLTSLDIIEAADSFGEVNGCSYAKLLQLNTCLQHLGLVGCGIEHHSAVQEFCVAFQKNTTLRSLDLSDNQLPPKDFNLLLQGLCSNSTLTTLRLGERKPSKAGHPMDESNIAALCHLLQENTSVTALHLGGLSFGRGTPDIIGSLLVNDAVQTLTLSHLKNFYVKETQQLLEEHPSLTDLTIHNHVDMTAPILQKLWVSLQRCRSVERFTLIGDTPAVPHDVAKAAFDHMYTNQRRRLQKLTKQKPLPRKR